MTAAIIWCLVLGAIAIGFEVAALVAASDPRRPRDKGTTQTSGPAQAARRR